VYLTTYYREAFSAIFPCFLSLFYFLLCVPHHLRRKACCAISPFFFNFFLGVPHNLWRRKSRGRLAGVNGHGACDDGGR